MKNQMSLLTPVKHMNLELSVLNVSAAILSMISKRRICSYDLMLSRLEAKFGNDVELVILPSLTFLYSLGLVEYHQKTDSIEFKEKK